MKKKSKTDTGHAISGKDARYSKLAIARQRRVRVYCAKMNIFKADFARLAEISLSTLYRYLRGAKLCWRWESQIKSALKKGTKDGK